MTEAIELSQKPQLTVTPEQAKIARNTIAKGLSDDEFAIFLYNCQRQGIHPLDGLLIPISRNDKDEGKRLTFVTTVDLLRSRAAESNEYAGNDDAVFSYGHGDYPEAATVTVWRNVEMTRCSFTATARWAEYYPGEKLGFMWRNKPHVMLGKAAEALALRKAFPKQLAGLYVAEELERQPIPSRPRKQALPPVGDVVCSFCGAKNSHLPDCKFAAAQCPECHAPQGKPHANDCSQAKQQQAEPEPEKKSEAIKWLVEVIAVDEREKTVDEEKKTKVKYLLLTCKNVAAQDVTLYCWHTGEVGKRIKAIKPKTRCIFMVKAQVTAARTFYSIDSIVEITGEQIPLGETN